MPSESNGRGGGWEQRLDFFSGLARRSVDVVASEGQGEAVQATHFRRSAHLVHVLVAHGMGPSNPGQNNNLLQFVLSDRRADFQEALDEIGAAVEDYIAEMLRLGEPGSNALEFVRGGRQFEILDRIQANCFRVVSCLTMQGDTTAVLADVSTGTPRRAGEAMVALSATLIQRCFVRLAVAALSLHQSTLQVLRSVEDAAETGNTARVKRYRERKRRRVAMRVEIDVYDDDLDLLRQFGLLNYRDRSDAAAVSASMELFLLQAFLTHPSDVPQPWRGRIAKQRGRVKALGGVDIDNDEA